jgi:hypothetical protein
MTPSTALDSTTGTEPNRSIRSASLTAGIALLLLSALSIFGFIVVVKGLVTPGDPAQTANDITESIGWFRLGIAALYLVIPLDIVVGWALYRVFSPVSKSLSMLAAILRVAFAVVFMVAISRLVDVLRLLDNDSHLAAFSPEQLHAQALLPSTHSTMSGTPDSFCSACTCSSSATWRSSPGTSRSSSQSWSPSMDSATWSTPSAPCSPPANGPTPPPSPSSVNSCWDCGS